ncbi:protein DpdF [Acrocarpospora corrugata]|uniref:protein DpdF n=1 Tax=Acrocarpospora corrugata TaxID=35763 RepID=UPI00147951B4|nr:protein DpdF [Acrocarpospora corrugata]
MTLDELRARDRRLDRRLSRRGASAADLAVLIRTGLIASRASLALPGTPFEHWDPGVWAGHGLLRKGTALRLAEWKPGWLDHYDTTAPDDAPSRRAPRRFDDDVPADVFYQQTMGHAAAKSFGQRDALRAAALAGPGDTVICVLPTGSGKSDVVLTRALRNRPRQAVIVVPTISLAIDLERRVQGLLGDDRDPFAYFGSADPSDKERIRDGIAAGSQWLTIAAPEAACTVLAAPLTQAAERGTLDLIVVDEAHIVAEWGDAFRPAFHALAGLRQRLLDTAPQGRQAATVLLTGTLDTYGLSTLTRLFGGRHRVLVSGQTTRSEPAWWSARCTNEADKRDKLIEALRHLPRPALVYTTLHMSERSTNTRTVRSWLTDAGFAAVAEIAGNPKPSVRQAAVRGLRLDGTPDEDLDIVVATSAFGLGIDIDDVRSVVHVCMPESVDRLYQEVGRSGRDGRAATALVLWTPVDMRVANDIARERLIGPDLAWLRWQSMRHGQWSGDELTVDLRAEHAGVTYPSSRANIYWNVQTLAAMDRAGMIRRSWPVPHDVPVDADDDEVEALFDAQRAAATVEILHSDLDDAEAFRARLAAGQRETRDAAAAALTTATDLIQGIDECVNHYLARRYRLEDDVGNQFPVSVGCGGCPHCRRTGRLPAPAPGHPTLLAGESHAEAIDDLRCLSADGRMSVRLGPSNDSALQTLVDRLLRRGVIVIVTADRKGVAWRTRATGPWWVEDVHAWSGRSNATWRVPTLLVVDPSLGDTILARALSRLARQPLGIVLTPRTRRDPANSRQLLHEAWTPSYEIEDLLRKI